MNTLLTKEMVYFAYEIPWVVTFYISRVSCQKGPIPDRALLAGYPRYVLQVKSKFVIWEGISSLFCLFFNLRNKGGQRSRSLQSYLPSRVPSGLWQSVCDSWGEAYQVLDGGWWRVDGQERHLDKRQRGRGRCQDGHHVVTGIWSCKNGT